MKGFLTIATGDKHYYILARNLLTSYMLHTNDPLPWAIICDESNEYSKSFDYEIVSDEVSCSFLDKIKMISLSPFDETLFIDADCLAFGDLNVIWDKFSTADDFSCFGRMHSLDSPDNWFGFSKIGEYQSRVTYGVGLHGGIYYFRKSQISGDVEKTALELIPDYSKYGFKHGTQEKPWDESLFALSMAINHCRPIPMDYLVIKCYWRYWDDLKMNIRKSLAISKKKKEETLLVHFGTANTKKAVYKRQELLLKNANGSMSFVDSMSLIKLSIAARFDKDLLYTKKVKMLDWLKNH